MLLGHGIGYSASPAMHNAAFAALGMDAEYRLADISHEGLAGAVAALRAPDHLGANVTKPYKVMVCDLADSLAPEVLRLGAANTLVNSGGRLIAHNTDLPALSGELAGVSSARRAVVLGNGGASRAVQDALGQLKINVTVVDRTRWSELPTLLRAADLLVNATPIGTDADESPVPDELLRPDLAVFDLVYRPSPTRLVRTAEAIGAPAQNGGGMLLAQAALSFELWTGRPAPVAVMAEALRVELGLTDA